MQINQVNSHNTNYIHTKYRLSYIAVDLPTIGKCHFLLFINKELCLTGLVLHSIFNLNIGQLLLASLVIIPGTYS